MIEIPITRDIYKEASERSIEMGALKNSITYGDGNIAGFIGEIVVAQFFNVKLERTFDYDMIWEGKRIEVKAKRTSVIPRPRHACSVAATNTGQKCDWYVFVRTLDDYSTAWILGYLTPTEYYGKSKLMKKGEIDPDSPPGKPFKIKADCFNVYISDLNPLDHINPLSTHEWW